MASDGAAFDPFAGIDVEASSEAGNEAQISTLRETNARLARERAQLSKENEKLKAKVAALEKNISCLYNTAKLELDRVRKAGGRSSC